MLLDHNSINSLGITESQEAKATRAAGGTITHDSALLNLTELREIVAEGLYMVKKA